MLSVTTCRRSWAVSSDALPALDTLNQLLKLTPPDAFWYAGVSSFWERHTRKAHECGEVLLHDSILEAPLQAEHLQAWAVAWHCLGRYDAPVMVSEVVVPWLTEFAPERYVEAQGQWVLQKIVSPEASPSSHEVLHAVIQTLLPPGYQTLWYDALQAERGGACWSHLVEPHETLSHPLSVLWWMCQGFDRQATLSCTWADLLPWVLACWLYPCVSEYLASIPEISTLPAGKASHYRQWSKVWQALAPLLTYRASYTHWATLWQSDTVLARQWRGVDALLLVEGASEQAVLPMVWQWFQQSRQAEGESFSTVEPQWCWMPMGGTQSAQRYWQRWGEKPWFQGAVWMLLDGDVPPSWHHHTWVASPESVPSRAVWILPEAHQLEDLYPLEALQGVLQTTFQDWGVPPSGLTHPSGELDASLRMLHHAFATRKYQEHLAPMQGGRWAWWQDLLMTLDLPAYSKLYLANMVALWIEGYLSEHMASRSPASEMPVVTGWLWQQWHRAYGMLARTLQRRCRVPLPTVFFV
ncbi:MAG: hypothetical protein ACKO37_03885 [Vampirovibrionales bacterium]